MCCTRRRSVTSRSSWSMGACPRSFPVLPAGPAIDGQVFQNYRLMLMKGRRTPSGCSAWARPRARSGQRQHQIRQGRSGERSFRGAGAALDEALGLTATDAPLIVAGSTHDDEEQTLFDVLRRIRQTPGLEGTRAVDRPTSPRTVRQSRRSPSGTASRPSPLCSPRLRAGGSADVLILDTIGELSAAYQFATVVFVGGTLIPHGGQSIMEPAALCQAHRIGPP